MTDYLPRLMGTLSGGGTSSPCNFSSLGGRFFPAGPSFRPGEMGTVELFCFINGRASLTLVAGASQREHPTPRV
jgi:hypothetical protein